jgi:outer membrane protein W
MRPTRLVLLVIALSFLPAAGAQAQPLGSKRPVSRVDATGTVAWLNVDKSGIDTYDDWYNRSVYGGGGFGWYWTDHLKTEVDGGISSRVERETYHYENVGGVTTVSESTFHFATRRIAIGQHYQFGRNAWFHPFIGGGVDLTWEEIDQEDGPITVFNINSRQPQITPPITHPTSTDLHTRPFVTFGFKSYMTPHGFFRSDIKFVIRNGVDEVLLRFGLGIDF